MSRTLVRTLLVFVPLLSINTLASAHDSWVNRGAFKNSSGEWCCGDYDCKSYTKAASSAVGWMIEG